MIIEVNTVNENGIQIVLDLKNKKAKYVVFFTLINIRWFCTSPNVFCSRGIVKEIFVRMPSSIFLNETALVHQFNIKIRLLCMCK